MCILQQMRVYGYFCIVEVHVVLVYGAPRVQCVQGADRRRLMEKDGLVCQPVSIVCGHVIPAL